MIVKTIDGSAGEGGGQILRTALALSLISGEPFRIENIRAGRAKPGLLRQHLTAVRAACEISGSKVDGDSIGSRSLLFLPRPARGGEYQLSIGSAGSASLVLQTILPPLLGASAPSKITIDGGTHNPSAPPFEYLERAFIPLLRKMGAGVELHLERHGFYPAGGGKLHAEITPSKLRPLELTERGALLRKTATAIISGLAGTIAMRELERVRERLAFTEEECKIFGVRDPLGPGNVLSIELESEHVTEVISSFGQKGVSAEEVADRACADVETYLHSKAPVGRRSADQILLPLVMAGGGRFSTPPLSSHAETQVALIQQFLPVKIEIREDPRQAHVEVRS